jgi:hypothetical protein
MAEEDIKYPVPARLLDPAQCPEPYVKSYEQYKEMHRQSIQNPDEFFGKVNSIIITFTRLVKSSFCYSSMIDHLFLLRGDFLDMEEQRVEESGQKKNKRVPRGHVSPFSHPWFFRLAFIFAQPGRRWQGERRKNAREYLVMEGSWGAFVYT